MLVVKFISQKEKEVIKGFVGGRKKLVKISAY